MPERIPIESPPETFGHFENESVRREWLQKVARAVRRIISERPTGVFVSNTPSQITADQDDYAHGQVDVLRLSSDASRTITGFDYQGSRLFWLVNVGSNNILLSDEDANSEAQNRIHEATGPTRTVQADESVLLWYDDTLERWRILGE